MIPFFRKARKKLADDNRPIKYMRYAIGEIVLVVVGILIALSINNWNEDRKAKNVETDILLSLKYEFENNFSSFEIINEVKENRKAEILAYLDLINDKQLSIKKKSVDRSGFFIEAWNPSNSVLRSLYSSGKQNYIENDSLKLALSRWEELVENYEYFEGSYLNIHIKLLEYEYLRIPLKFRLDGIVTYRYYTNEEIIMFREKFIEEIKYHNFFGTGMELLTYQLELAEEIKIANTDIMNFIDKEIFERNR